MTSHEIIRVGQIEVRFLLEAARTAGSLAMFDFLVPAGARVPVPHSHDAYDETVYGVEGVMTWTLAGQTTHAASPSSRPACSALNSSAR